VAGFAADVNISPLQRVFVADVLHQAPTSDNPLASSVLGTVLVQLFSTLCIVVPIVVLIKASGADLGSLFISRSRSWPVVALGFLGLRERVLAFGGSIDVKGDEGKGTRVSVSIPVAVQQQVSHA